MDPDVAQRSTQAQTARRAPSNRRRSSVTAVSAPTSMPITSLPSSTSPFSCRAIAWQPLVAALDRERAGLRTSPPCPSPHWSHASAPRRLYRWCRNRGPGVERQLDCRVAEALVLRNSCAGRRVAPSPLHPARTSSRLERIVPGHQPRNSSQGINGLVGSRKRIVGRGGLYATDDPLPICCPRRCPCGLRIDHLHADALGRRRPRP